MCVLCLLNVSTGHVLVNKITCSGFLNYPWWTLEAPQKNMSPSAPKILVPRILVPGSWYQDLSTKILVPRSQDLGTRILVPGSRYQDLGTNILVPRSWYQDLGTKIYGEPERRSLSVCRGARGAAGPLPGDLGGCKPPNTGTEDVFWSYIFVWHVFSKIIIFYLVSKSQFGKTLGCFGRHNYLFFSFCGQFSNQWPGLLG